MIQLWLIRKLNIFVAFVHPDHDGHSVYKFVTQVTSSGWVLSQTACSFPDFGDLVIGKASIIVGVHDSTQTRTEQISFRIPPSQNLFPWPHTFGSRLISQNTASPLQRMMNHSRLILTMALWPQCHPGWCWHPFQTESNPCIIYICGIQTQRFLLAWLSYLLTASVPLLMIRLTLTCSIANSESNFTRTITPTSMLFCRSNSRLALD